jgi:hypothetical protein
MLTSPAVASIGRAQYIEMVVEDANGAVLDLTRAVVAWGTKDWKALRNRPPSSTSRLLPL